MLIKQGTLTVMREVDLIVLSRTAGELAKQVREGISAQQGVTIRVHRLVGEPRPQDASRWETIARARNRGKQMGTSPWLMFLDDDVVLEPGCVRRLLNALQRRPHYGALAADYLGERRTSGRSRHVAMGATMFRRSALRLFQFRWEDDLCECQCCCDDLRRQGIAITYCPAARARHLNSSKGRSHHADAREGGARGTRGSVKNSPTVLAAFDRRHFHKFLRQFLKSLRGAGNAEPVTAVCYGLFPSQRRMLERLPDVRVLALPASRRDYPPQRRLQDFQSAIADLDRSTPVAYWDAGDVVFQGRLTDLWKQVRAWPNKLLAAREPVHHPENGSVVDWTLSIRDPNARQRAFDLLSRRPVLNSGFAAATAATMLRYLRRADQLLHSTALEGTADWGDQTALNLYCHTKPEVWQEVEEGWNYCLFGREPGELGVGPDARLISRKGAAIHVIHGNARTLYASYYRLGGRLPAANNSKMERSAVARAPAALVSNDS